ncbi:MAG: CCA tRNA nucleotidyltransferase [Alphaproteobacteria bacterium]|nr:CCA tRNA nucleotidyltransferase [Alphaproteobacteria bacterium]
MSFDPNFMQPDKTISPMYWMKEKELRGLFDALQDDLSSLRKQGSSENVESDSCLRRNDTKEEDSDKPKVLLVGGCVRNTLMGHEVEDIDLASVHKPEEIQKRLERAGYSVIPTGLQHGTITAVANGKAFEITTLRHDKETDGRRATVEFTDDWLEDAKRRDFTINALFMDLEGNVYDPLGQGLKDIEEKNIRFVGKAGQRIEEDYLRILRFFRFHALYGGQDYDKEGLKACKAGADKIVNLSRERITQEFLKILASDNPQDILDIMFKHNVLKDLDFSKDYPEKDFFRYFCNFQKKYRLSALSSRIFVMAGLSRGNMKALEKYLLLPKVFLKDALALGGALALRDLSCDSAVREAVYRFGRSVTAQALMVELVQDRVMNSYAPVALDIVQNWDVPDFPVSGDDILKAGYKKGPEIGERLKALEDWWIDQDFKPDRACIMNQT